MLEANRSLWKITTTVKVGSMLRQVLMSQEKLKVGQTELLEYCEGSVLFEVLTGGLIEVVSVQAGIGRGEFSAVDSEGETIADTDKKLEKLLGKRLQSTYRPFVAGLQMYNAGGIVAMNKSAVIAWSENTKGLKLYSPLDVLGK